MSLINIRSWLIIGALSLGLGMGAIASPAFAQSDRANLVIDGSSHPTLESLLQQAKTQTQSFVEQAFAKNPEQGEVQVTLMVERNGQVAPLFSVRVSRPDWQQNPRLEQWVQYFNGSEVLLGFRTLPSSSPAVAQRATRSNSDDGRSFDGLPLVPPNLDEILAKSPPLLH
jgi:hypothetical protein